MNRQNRLKLKYENKQKNIEKFHFSKLELDNKNEKIEKEVVKVLVKIGNLPIEIDKEFKNQTVPKIELKSGRFKS